MSNALMIKNADFSANKLCTVQLTDAIPCTRVTLNESALSMNHLGATAQLTASVLPINTTDTVIWSCSNSNVVTVANGLVTQVGVGTATITATCGSYSASCTVTATNVLEYNNWKSTYHAHGASGFDYAYPKPGDPCYAFCFGKVETPYWCDVDELTNPPADHVCPIRLGGNATTINITAPDTIRVSVLQLNCDEPCNRSITNPTPQNIHFAKYIGGDANVYTTTPGNREVSVLNGANSILVTMRMKDSSNITDSNIASVTITAS